LKRGEVAHPEDHLRHGIPDLRLATLPDRHTDLALRRDLPVTDTATRHLLGFTGQFADLSSRGVPETLQHDDPHMAKLYAEQGRLRILDGMPRSRTRSPPWWSPSGS
jgi:hypothetical protein